MCTGFLTSLYSILHVDITYCTLFACASHSLSLSLSISPFEFVSCFLRPKTIHILYIYLDRVSSSRPGGNQVGDYRRLNHDARLCVCSNACFLYRCSMISVNVPCVYLLFVFKTIKAIQNRAENIGQPKQSSNDC